VASLVLVMRGSSSVRWLEPLVADRGTDACKFSLGLFGLLASDIVDTFSLGYFQFVDLSRRARSDLSRLTILCASVLLNLAD
jgi:hypothetical protein